MDPVFEIITDQSSIACYCCCFLNLIFALFLFLFSSHYFKKVSMDPVSQRFGHPRVLGIPIPTSLAFWASPSHIAAAFWASPGTLPGCPNR